MRNQFWIYAGTIVAMSFWGLSYIWYKEVYVYVDPITTIEFRLLISTLLLTVFSLAIRKLQLIRKKDITWLLLLSLFEPFLYFLGESLGIKVVSSTLASVIIATIPLFTPITGHYFFNEKITLKNYVGILLSIVGVLLVMYNDMPVSGNSVAGVSLMFLAVFAGVGYSVVVKKMAGSYNPFTIVTYQNAIGAVLFIPLILRWEWHDLLIMKFTPEMFFPLLKLAVFASTIAFLLFTISIKQLGITKSAVFANSIPVFTALFAFIILKENMSFLKIIGIVIVIFGLFLSQINRLKSRKIRR